MDKQLMAAAFNEWMRRFIEEPERFEHEFQTVSTFQREDGSGREPSYGQTSTAYLHDIAAEITAGKQAAR